MYKQIKYFFLGLVLALGLVSSPFTALAQGSNYGLDETASKAGYDKNETVQSTVDKVISTILALLAIIFFILVTYAGFRWMTARGNEEVAAEAKNILEAAIIGLIVILSAYALTSFIFKRLDTARETALNDPKVPNPPPTKTCAEAAGTCAVSCTNASDKLVGTCPATTPECCGLPL